VILSRGGYEDDDALQPPGPAMTLDNMRHLGVLRLAVSVMVQGGSP
jgi:hypothetical protein